MSNEFDDHVPPVYWRIFGLVEAFSVNVAGILIRLSAGTFRLLNSFAIFDVLPFCGIFGRHSGSCRWQCPVCLSIFIYQSKYHSDIRVRRTSVTFGADYNSYKFFEEICCFRLQSRKFNLRQNEQCSYIFKMELRFNLSDILYNITSRKTIVFRHWTFQSSSRIL